MTAVMVKTLELYAEMTMENQKSRMTTILETQKKRSTITSCTPSKAIADHKVAINADQTPAAQRPT